MNILQKKKLFLRVGIWHLKTAFGTSALPFGVPGSSPVPLLLKQLPPREEAHDALKTLVIVIHARDISMLGLLASALRNPSHWWILGECTVENGSSHSASACFLCISLLLNKMGNDQN